jgi:hypothetical protein
MSSAGLRYFAWKRSLLKKKYCGSRAESSQLHSSHLSIFIRLVNDVARELNLMSSGNKMPGLGVLS